MGVVCGLLHAPDISVIVSGFHYYLDDYISLFYLIFISYCLKTKVDIYFFDFVLDIFTFFRIVYVQLFNKQAAENHF